MKRTSSVSSCWGWAALSIALAVVVALPAGAFAAAGDSPENGITVGTSLHNDTSLPLRDAPAVPFLLQRLHPQFEPKGFPRNLVTAHDPVVQDYLAPEAMPATILNFDGIGFPGVACNCAPPDTNGEVGATQYVQMVNEGLQVWDKVTGTSVLGPVGISTLWTGFGGLCETNGNGDPVVLYDQLANRWVVTQFAGTSIPTHECIAVSTTSDATGTWNRYDFLLGTNFFDYPKLGVWPDGYYMAMNVFNSSATAFLGPQPFVFDRAAMLAGTPATFITPGLQADTLGSLICGDLDGAILPPAGAPNPWLSIELPTWKLFRFHVDWAVPANSTFTLGTNLTPAGYTVLGANVPQLGTADTLDTLADRPMFRLAYRRFGDGHEALVGNLTVASGGVAAVRWWEIDNVTSGTATFVQQGTYQPDTTWRWMASAAMDFVGDIVVGFSASSSSINPQIRYAGRVPGDPINTLGQGEATLFAGTGSQTGTSSRWGDYSDLTIDPVDDCTFWYTNEYYSTTTSFNWKTRIGNFKMPGCSLSPTFTLGVVPGSQDICVPANGVYTVNVGSVSGFTNQVTLSATGNPAGTTVGFSTNPVTPPGSSTMTIGNTAGAAAGPYSIDVQGQSADPITVHQLATLNVFTGSPGAPTLLTPADSAINVALSPSFTWSAATQVATYTLEVATDAAFTAIVHTASGLAGTSYSGATLPSNTHYFWRVRAVNACGVGANSAVFSFTTLPLPGDCTIGTIANALYTENFDSGAPGWTHSGTGDTWAVSAARPHSAPSSYFAVDSASVSDQRLVSPPVVIPAGNPPVSLKFWNYQDIEARTGGCYDGGILEVTTNGGSTWTQLTGASLLTDPYDGPVSASFSNPLANLNAWCGAPQAYLNSIVDLTSYAGQTVQFRFRLGTDTSVTHEGWYIDDMIVQNCLSGDPMPFLDGFESGNTSAWSLTVP